MMSLKLLTAPVGTDSLGPVLALGVARAPHSWDTGHPGPGQGQAVESEASLGITG